MRLKPNCKYEFINQAIADATLVCYHVLNKHGYEFVKTSIADGEHGEGSLHPSGEAFDFRSKHIPLVERKKAILKEIQESLTQDFDVLLENIGEPNEHFHLEYQPK